jgi:AcrR family transcriptional regulator
MSNTVEIKAESNEARNRLVCAALRLFAEKGFEAATTREICEAAGANISAIRYYFGDKAGLYRAAFTEPLGGKSCHANLAAYGNLALPEALKLLFRDFLEPLKLGEEFSLVMKLHFREMIEPTGAWQEKTEAEIKPQHQALVCMLIKHLNLTDVDADTHRLAFAIIGMAVHFYVAQEVVLGIAPQILNTPQAIDILAERLAGYALAMIEGEAKRLALEANHAKN